MQTKTIVIISSIIIVIIMIGGIFVGVNTTQYGVDKYAVSSETVISLLQNKEHVLVVDIRSAEQYRTEHLDGDTHDFNPNPYVAIILSFILPFAFSLVFWSASKTFNGFGMASASAFVFVMMNITSNIFTSEKLLIYILWFTAPMISAIIADYILSTRIKSNLFQKHGSKISGLILGSMFFIFCFPMLAMTFLDLYLFNDVFSYDVLHTTSDTVFQIWMMTIIPGAISGMLGMIFASRKLSHIANLTIEKSKI